MGSCRIGYNMEIAWMDTWCNDMFQCKTGLSNLRWEDRAWNEGCIEESGQIGEEYRDMKGTYNN